MAVLAATDLEHFADRGYVRVPGAFGADRAAAMRDVVWSALEVDGYRRDDPATWTSDPQHLQRLKRNPVFRAVGSDRTLGAIDDLLGVGTWRRPADWGAFFILFPSAQPFTAAFASWHADHSFTLPLAPLSELKVHAMFGDVAPRAGGMHILAGSHRVVAAHFARHPPAPGAKAARLRKELMRSHPYLVDLETPGDPGARIERFMARDEDVDGVPAQVVELTATAGEVILMHPLMLHARPVNAGRAPRFLLNKDLYAARDP